MAAQAILTSAATVVLAAKIPVHDRLGRDLVDVLAARPAGTRERKAQFVLGICNVSVISMQLFYVYV